MEEEKYIILRSRDISAPARGEIGKVRRGELFPREVSSIVRLEEAELTKRERNDMRRDPSTLAIARPMPMKLIAPVSRTSAAAPATMGT